jgi:hypothetical protein
MLVAKPQYHLTSLVTGLEFCHLFKWNNAALRNKVTCKWSEYKNVETFSVLSQIKDKRQI